MRIGKAPGFKPISPFNSHFVGFDSETIVPAGVRRKMEYGDEVYESEKRRMMKRVDLYGFDKDEVAETNQDLQVESPALRLRGKLDVVLRLRDGELIPVDTKYTDSIVPQHQHLKQLHAYALLLEETGKRPVKRGLIYFYP